MDVSTALHIRIRMIRRKNHHHFSGECFSESDNSGTDLFSDHDDLCRNVYDVWV